MILGLLATLFGCGDGKPGLLSSSGYHIGKQKVWYKTSQGISYQVDEVRGADPKTFAVHDLHSKIYPESSAFYGMDQSNVYWAASKIAGADPASFEYLCANYSKDKNAVYYMADRLTEDLDYFVVLNHELVKDSKYVYFGSGVFSADPAHFVAVGTEESGYYKDSQKCWYSIYELKNADPLTLQALGPKTARDAKHLYFEMNEVEGADLKTYQILIHDFSKDAHHVYLKGERIESAKPATFRVLDDHYSLDDEQCYYYTTPIPNADPNTFQVIRDSYTKDARQVFVTGKLIEGADPATFRILNGQAGCSCDAHYAYTMEKRIKGVDPKKIPANATCKSCNETEITF